MSKIKEIWCMHHSHLDIGYTHPQPMLMELQGDYIEQAIALCEETRSWPEESQFKWTCEATYPLVKWMEHAEPELVQRLVTLVKEGRISVAALPMHTTPCSTDMQMINMMEGLTDLRKSLSSDIKTAINHDINGQPWTMSQILLDSGVNFYMTGINVHFGGIPFKRPMAFRWKTADGRELLSYVGEHYSLFSQLFQTCEADTEKMHQGILEYADRLEIQNHNWDFALLTATNPPLFDNNCPDADLANLIRRYNAENHEFKVRFATPEMLRDRLLSMGIEQFPVYAGDWTDYWNFGCASSARETRVNKMTLKALESAGTLECMTGNPGSRYLAVRKEAEENALLYNEHTWGASQSMSDPEDYESQSQYIHKVSTAYRAADLTGYLIGNRLEALADNPFQSADLEGIFVVNPTGVTQNVELQIPKAWKRQERQLSAFRAKDFIPYIDNRQPKKYFSSMEKEDCGMVSIPPFTGRTIPFEALSCYHTLKEEVEKFSVEEGSLETPYYKVSINKDTGRIYQLYDKIQGRDLLDEEKNLAFFEIIRETVDGRFHAEERQTLFPRDVELCNQSISCWQHDWKAKRLGAECILDWDLKLEGRRAVLSWKPELPEVGSVEQEAIFYSDSDWIDLKIKMVKRPVHKPEGIYLTFPLKLSEGWECTYNTAGQFVKLDEEQLGHVCRDWVTVDNGIAVYDTDICYGLACPQAPMVQVGDFNFGKEHHAIERKENPLLLAWPLNNYWDTNFVSGQSGAMEFSYRFFSKRCFEPTEMYSEFVRAEQRGLIGAAVKAEAIEKTLISADREGFITAVYPEKNAGEGYILVLRNHESSPQELSFEITEWDNIRAYEVTVQQELRKEIPCTGPQVSLCLPPRAFMLVRVCRG